LKEIEMDIMPLSKKIHDKAKEMGIQKISLKFEGGNDEGHLNVHTDPQYLDFEREIYEWAWGTYPYNGAGDGTDYGDNITYDLGSGKASHQSWYFQPKYDDPTSVTLEVE
jgi:hypothetical protein